MRLLIITQKVDKNDENLGFFHDWIAEFARHADRVFVITAFLGDAELPSNVTLFSLGKERGASRLWRWREFLGLFSRYYAMSDAVFFHMIPEYVFAAAPFLWSLPKPSALWYTHKSVTPFLKFAERAVDYCLSASELSFRLPSKKLIYTGHAINTKFFSPVTDANIYDSELRILTTGRISPVKRLEVIINACALFRERFNRPWRLTVIGGPVMPRDHQYFFMLKRLVGEKNLGGFVFFEGSASFVDMPEIYRRHTMFLSASTTGSLDKAVLEAAACGLTVLTANEAYKPILPPKYFLEGANPNLIAERIKILADEPRLNLALRDMVIKNHNLSHTITYIVDTLSRPV